MAGVMTYRPGVLASAGGGIGAGTLRQMMIPASFGSQAAVYVNTTIPANKQYALPNGAYLNEQR